MSISSSPPAEKTPSDDFNTVTKMPDEKPGEPAATPPLTDKPHTNADRYIPGPYDFWGP